jgi:hypothetical protein
MSVLQSVVLTLIATPLVASEWVYDPEFQFGFSVPDGFVKDHESEQGKVLFAFQRRPIGNEKMGRFILVSRLGGVLGREKIDSKEAASINPQVTIMTEKWKGFDIDVFRVPTQVGNLQLLTFNAQVPLTPEAVQIGVSGEAASENELRSELRSVLGSLKGQTNWLNTEQRFRRITPLQIKVGILVVIVGIILFYVRRRILTAGVEEPNVPAKPPPE